ncbi:MAG TPA: gephyrin-like molybdotransferase Glp [Thermoanaerobaculia bacterium]|nr:gephyrin-like molybdotransferase Glp [Thermoanaerobaculia bacterium]
MTTFQTARAGERMLAVEEAQQRVLDEVALLGTENVAFTETLGRVLREDVTAVEDIPQGDNTAMDGYAVRAEDIAAATDEAPVVLQVIEDLPAGATSAVTVKEGTAVRIMTGALIPRGADTVAHVEITDGGSDRVKVFRPLTSGTNVRRQGEDMRAGAVVLESGTPLGAAEIGVLASVQRSVVRVGRRPSVAILSTGDEIVDVDQPRAAGKVVNSNSYALAALARQSGAVPRLLGIVRDDRDATVAAIQSALESDFIVSSGGVSVGAYDFVKDALDALGAETKFWQVAMKPGKPIVLSRVRERIFFGLPGNPVSCMVSFLLFIAPAIRKAMGQQRNLFPPVVHARLGTGVRSRGDRRNYLRARVSVAGGLLVVDPMPAQGSGVSTSMVQANGLIVMETGITSAEAGETVPVVVFDRLHSEPITATAAHP